MTAVTDMEQSEQFAPAFLEVLSRSSIAIAMAEGEKKTQDLRINRQLPDSSRRNKMRGDEPVIAA
jgi:hypothetical protein